MDKRFSIGNKYEFCPNGNYWQEISGVFDREVYLFCDCAKCDGQVYVLRARKVKLEESRLKELVDDLRRKNKLKEVRSLVSYTNMNQVAKAISQKDSL